VQQFVSGYGDVNAAREYMQSAIAQYDAGTTPDFLQRAWASNPEGYKRYMDEMRVAQEFLAKNGDRFSSSGGGRMYEVGIHADPQRFLDWDKPLSEQPARVIESLNDWGRAHHGYDKDIREVWKGAGKGIPGPSVYSSFVAHAGSEPAATVALREAGIPGIKYLDQGSRTAGEGSRNYVVFDDKIIDILRKYGIAGLAPLGAAAGGVANMGMAIDPRASN
jgi:hypothetical protein